MLLAIERVAIGHDIDAIGLQIEYKLGVGVTDGLTELFNYLDQSNGRVRSFALVEQCSPFITFRGLLICLPTRSECRDAFSSKRSNVLQPLDD